MVARNSLSFNIDGRRIWDCKILSIPQDGTVRIGMTEKKGVVRHLIFYMCDQILPWNRWPIESTVLLSRSRLSSHSTRLLIGVVTLTTLFTLAGDKWWTAVETAVWRYIQDSASTLAHGSSFLEVHLLTIPCEVLSFIQVYNGSVIVNQNVKGMQDFSAAPTLLDRLTLLFMANDYSYQATAPGGLFLPCCMAFFCIHPFSTRLTVKLRKDSHGSRTLYWWRKTSLIVDDNLQSCSVVENLMKVELLRDIENRCTMTNLWYSSHDDESQWLLTISKWQSFARITSTKVPSALNRYNYTMR